jgi:DNA-binding MarR family transcriptional regulator
MERGTTETVGTARTSGVPAGPGTAAGATGSGAGRRPGTGGGSGSSADSPREQLVGRVIAAELALRRQLMVTRMSPLLDLNLTMQQTKVLLALTFQGCGTQVDCGLSGQDLARHLGVGLATVSGIVDRLVAQGLVARAEDPTDRRIRRVELTGEGRALVERLRDAGVDHLRRLTSRLDDETLAALEMVLHRLAVAAAEEIAASPEPADPDTDAECGAPVL